jgi:hypothetical protein
MSGQGCAFSQGDLQRIIVLLNSEIPIKYIAERMQCSRSAILAINRRYSVRNYAGRRSTWQTSTADSDDTDPPLSQETAIKKAQ